MLALRNLAILLSVGLSTAGCFVARETVDTSAAADAHAEFNALLEAADEPPAKEIAPPSGDRTHKFDVANAERRLQSTIQLPSRSGLRGKIVETDGWRLVGADRRFLTPYFRQTHWRHRELEAVLQEETADAMLLAATESENLLVRATAAIGLARRDQLDSPLLMAAVENRDLPTSTRSAALEALALAKDLAAVDQLYDSRETWMAAEEPSPAQLLGAEKLEAELMYALALREHVRSDLRVIEALASEYDNVRAAALDAMYLDWSGELPPEAAQLLEDRAEMVSSAARRTAAPLDELRSALVSAVMSLRRDAIYGMARSGQPEALDALAKLDENASIVCLIAATDVWAIRGDFQRIADLATHPEHRVRSAVAELLTIDLQQELLAAVPKLLDDPSSQVRDRALDSLEGWPKQPATAAMLTALRKSESPYTGKVIAQRLAARLQEPPLAADETVAEALARLEEAWRVQFGSLPEENVAVSEDRVSRQTALELLQLVQQYEQAKTPQETDAAKRLLLTKQTVLLTTLDQLAPELQEVPLPRLRENVLPEISADFAAWRRATQSSDTMRLSALRELTQASRKHLLNQYLLQQVADSCRLDAAEEEMHAILEIIQQDSRPAAARIVGLALHHRAATVRRQSVAWCERYASHEYAGILSTLLTDKDRGVRLATAVALRYYPGRSTTTALLGMIGDSDDDLAVAAAGSLAYLHVQEGIDALNRFSRHRIERTRRLAVEAMGISGDEAFAPTLIRMLGESQSVRRAALEALPKVVGEDIAAKEKGFHDANSQIAAWQAWYAAKVSSTPTTY
ncbi:HEAT repeat domain-containing protein [Blastopirellula sp. J2-11]|uniref:HEAT repeat domain-containing protein n=1 Tax=Blastopirellula sp. J2-11 TaxID=2943192 RepID=UPI0021C653BF|nr:HEAT repeat domain-containing protein [Blastopirellula sp. J2-11]UUO05585.1 HEAT repeat domain-containing protein [Blastopirellula sp. J2-11]